MRTNQDGFGMTGMSVVLSTMIIIVSAAAPIYQGAVDVAQETTAIEDIKAIADAVDTFRLTKGVLPDTLVEVGMNNRVDPWGNFYIYKNVSSPRAVDLNKPVPETESTYTKNGDGSYSLDFDGDGKMDMRSKEINPVMIEKLKAIAKRLDANREALNTDYDLFSFGEDGDTEATLDSVPCKDDILRGRNGDFVDRGDKYK
ncbi:MAG: type II secretory pathway pseudopilin PulG [Planctomycetota bacterium]|jgi:type II secretory pathway pseudopilin PulG